MQTKQVQIGQLPKLFHVQSNTYINLPFNLPIIHIGKANDRIAPNIDVSHLPNSDVVSRVHANIRVEGGNYFLEDAGSANGTYLNHSLLAPLTRYSLKVGDRIDFGKDNKVTFLLQLANNVPGATSKAEDEEEEQVALFSKFLGLALMLGGLAFLAGSITIGGILNAPLVMLSVTGILVLNYGGSIRHLGWVLIGLGVTLAIATGTIVLAPITLLALLLAGSAASAGYQLFTSGKVLDYNIFSLKEILKK